MSGLNSSIYIYIYIYIEGPSGGHTAAPLGDWHLGSSIDIGELVQDVKRMRLALVSASGTPTATNFSFLQFRARGTWKIRFLGEKRFILTGRMFPNDENTIY